MRYPVKVGDLGMYRGKIIIVLQLTELFLKIMKIKKRKTIKIHPNSPMLSFPAGYFKDRTPHIQECGKFLTYVHFLKQNKIFKKCS